MGVIEQSDIISPQRMVTPLGWVSGLQFSLWIRGAEAQRRVIHLLPLLIRKPHEVANPSLTKAGKTSLRTMRGCLQLPSCPPTNKSPSSGQPQPLPTHKGWTTGLPGIFFPQRTQPIRGSDTHRKHSAPLRTILTSTVCRLSYSEITQNLRWR